MAQILDAGAPKTGESQARITRPIQDAERTVLRGDTYLLAQAQFDEGAAPADLPQRRILMLLKRSPQQEAALQQFLAAQQKKGWALYHQWLSPDEFGSRFGIDEADLEKITAWLAGQGFTDILTNHAKTLIEFSGDAGQVQSAFHTSIHKYVVNGEAYWANASDPSIPTALAPVVAGLVSLHNFPRHSQVQEIGTFRRNKAGSGYQLLQEASPAFTGFDPNSNQNYYALGPGDFAAVYDLGPVWNQSINGTGQTIAIAGQTEINLADDENFRSSFGLPANDPQIILDGDDPGVVSGDETEADLDTQWAGAIAPAATVDLVVSASTETTAGVDLSAEYIVDNNLAGVLSDSYGDCELGLGTTGNQFYGELWEQAAAQGITVLVASGDEGSAGCDYNAAQAQYGLAVNGIASTPWNVAMGGTDFNQYGQWTQYWSSTNASTTQASALGYIPEMTWNDSCTNTTVLDVEDAWAAGMTAEQVCNGPSYLGVVGGSGGKSGCTSSDGQNVSSCTGGWPKPSWQSGAGVPADGVRDLPDVSLFASAGVTRSFFIICQQDRDVNESPCGLQLQDVGYDFQGVGGTSASSPAMAGIMALIDQQYGRQGDANYTLYQLAGGSSAATVFHDITVGTIAMPCLQNSPDCVFTNSADAYGVLSGYDAGPGYDLATGLGSVDVANLVKAWNTVSLSASSTSLALNGGQAAVTAVHGSPISAGVTVTSSAGTPSGDISIDGAATDGSVFLGTLANGEVSGNVRALPGGSYNVVAHYPGNSQFAASDSDPVAATITPEKSNTKVQLKSLDPWTGAVADVTTAPYGTLFVVRSNVQGASGYGEPSGSVVLDDNGQALDHPSYALNSQGNAEDLTLNLQGGQHTLKANYSGDESFDASSGSTPLTVTPATMYCYLNFNTKVLHPGWFLQVFSEANIDPATGAAPPNGTTVAATGTMSFFSGSTLLAGPVTVTGHGSAIISNVPGILTFETAGANTTFTVQASQIPSYANPITFSYSGDGNYAGCTSPPLTISYTSAPMPTTVQAAFPSGDVNQGDPLSIGLTVAQVNSPPTGEPDPFPSGTLQLVMDGANYGSPATLDSRGKATIAIDTSTISAGSHSFTANYSGDTNYQPSTGGTWVIQVFAPAIGLKLSSSRMTVTNGATTSPITVTASSQHGFQGVVSFSCSGLPPASTCAFSPSTVTNGGTTQLTIATTQASVILAKVHSEAGHQWWLVLGGSASSACFIVAFLPLARRRRRFLTAAGVAAFLVVGISSCGGGSGSQTGPPQTYSTITTLTATTAKPAEGQADTFTAVVSSTGHGGTPNGTVTFFADQSTTGSPVNLTNGSAAWATSFSTAGSHTVSATYGGTSEYPGSNSKPYSLSVPYAHGTIPGDYSVTITATSGSVSANAALSLTVQ